MFQHAAIEQIRPNWILFNLQPNECMRFEIQAKQPGLEMRAQALIIIPLTLFSPGVAAPLQNMVLRAQTHIVRQVFSGFVIQARARTERMDASTCTLSAEHNEAYEGLILDVIAGDHTHFLRSDEINWAWQVVDPELKLWATERDFISTYPAGTWGPGEANRLFDREDQYWRNGLDEEYTQLMPNFLFPHRPVILKFFVSKGC